MQRFFMSCRGVSRLVCVAALVMLSLMSGRAFAQFGASLSGTVQDPSQGVLSKATVTLTNTQTQQKFTAVTGDSGSYRFGELPGGTYSLDVSAPGFKTSTVAVTVTPEQPRDLDVTLSPGGATESVTVNAEETIALQTADGSISTTLDNQQFEKVPTYGRDPYNLLRTAPGITGDGARSGNGTAVYLPNSVGPGGSNFGIAQAENTVQISANGQRITDNNFLLDGVSVNSLGYGGAAVVTPNIEAIGSVTITSTSFSAEDGRNTGAQIRTVTKSGTNQLHGGAVFQYDEPGLNAYNKFGGPSGQRPVRVATKNRDYAASLGGPVIKDKLFLFGSFEGFNLSNKGFTTNYVDTQQFRDLVHSVRPGSVADKIVSAPGSAPRITQVLAQSCTIPYDLGKPCAVVNGGLDIGSPTGARGQYVPFSLADNGGGGLDGIPDIEYVQLVVPSSASGRQYNGRVDYNLSNRDQLAGTVYVTKLYNNTAGASNSRANADIPFNPQDIATTFIYIHTFSPTVLNEFRANWTRLAENGVSDAANKVNFGLPYINIQNQNFNALNNVQFGVPFAPTTPAIFAENTYEIRDTVTKTFGAHTLKLGMEARREENNNNLIGGSRPVYAFHGVWNFVNDAPIYEGIYADPATGGPGNSARHLHDHYYAGFVQHDWKATPTLTLNSGLRWEYFEPIYNSGQNILYPQLGTTPGRELLDAQLVPRNHLWNSQFKNFSPKVGFAFSPANLHGRSVVRGGFALAYNRLNDVLFDPAVENGPGIFNYGLCCGTSSTPFAGGQIQYGTGTSNSPASYAPNPALKTTLNSKNLPVDAKGVPISIEVYGAESRLPTPYSYLYSMEVQNDLGRQLVLTVGYQGSTGRHYSRLVNHNFINAGATVGGVGGNPFGNGAYIATNDSNQYYNALNVHLVKRYKSGLSLDGTYTYSKSMDQVSSGDGANSHANQTFPQNNAIELAPSDFDTRHRLVAIATYDLSLYHGDSYLTRLALNGWQLNGIFTAHTGYPWTPVTNLINGIPTLATQAVIGPIRPTYYQGSYSPTCDNSAFIAGRTVTGRFGVVPTATNAPGIGRNSFRGPCYQQIDLSVGKEIRLPFLGEQGLVRLQAQSFNLFNKLNLSPFTFNTSSTQLDSGVCTSSNIGTATGCGTGTAVGTVVPGLGLFGKPTDASAGRVIELNARFSF